MLCAETNIVYNLRKYSIPPLMERNAVLRFLFHFYLAVGFNAVQLDLNSQIRLLARFGDAGFSRVQIRDIHIPLRKSLRGMYRAL